MGICHHEQGINLPISGFFLIWHKGLRPDILIICVVVKNIKIDSLCAG
jgi:hypothetical protein